MGGVLRYSNMACIVRMACVARVFSVALLLGRQVPKVAVGVSPPVREIRGALYFPALTFQWSEVFRAVFL